MKNIFIIFIMPIIDIPKSYFKTVYEVILRPIKFAKSVEDNATDLKNAFKFFGRSITITILILTVSNYFLKLPSLNFSFNLIFTAQLVCGICLFPLAVWVVNDNNRATNYSLMFYVYVAGSLLPMFYFIDIVIKFYDLHTIIFRNALNCPDRTLECLAINYGSLPYQYYQKIQRNASTCEGFIAMTYMYLYLRQKKLIAWYKYIVVFFIWFFAGKQLVEPAILYAARLIHETGF